MVFYTSSGVQTIIDELSLYAYLVSECLMEREKFVVFTGFASFVLIIDKNVSPSMDLRDSMNAARTNRAPHMLSGQL